MIIICGKWSLCLPSVLLFSFSASTYPISPVKLPNYYDYVHILVAILKLLKVAEYRELKSEDTVLIPFIVYL